jgi:hypothetical protein
MKTIYIYTLANPITNEIRYVGKTNNIKARYLGHLSKNNPKSHKANWIKSLTNQGLNPKLEILDIVSIENWKFWEKYWISQLLSWGFNLTNHTFGGEGSTFGNSGSFKKSHLPWNLNKKGYSTTKKGTFVPEDVKKKISLTLTGRPSLKKVSVKQFDKNMNLIQKFASITEARNITGIKGINNALTGRAKTAGGYIWR